MSSNHTLVNIGDLIERLKNIPRVAFVGSTRTKFKDFVKLCTTVRIASNKINFLRSVSLENVTESDNSDYIFATEEGWTSVPPSRRLPLALVTKVLKLANSRSQSIASLDVKWNLNWIENNLLINRKIRLFPSSLIDEMAERRDTLIRANAIISNNQDKSTSILLPSKLTTDKEIMEFLNIRAKNLRVKSSDWLESLKKAFDEDEDSLKLFEEASNQRCILTGFSLFVKTSTFTSDELDKIIKCGGEIEDDLRSGIFVVVSKNKTITSDLAEKVRKFKCYVADEHWTRKIISKEVYIPPEPTRLPLPPLEEFGSLAGYMISMKLEACKSVEATITQLGGFVMDASLQSLSQPDREFVEVVAKRQDYQRNEDCMNMTIFKLSKHCCQQSHHPVQIGNADIKPLQGHTFICAGLDQHQFYKVSNLLTPLGAQVNRNATRPEIVERIEGHIDKFGVIVRKDSPERYNDLAVSLYSFEDICAIQDTPVFQLNRFLIQGGMSKKAKLCNNLLTSIRTELNTNGWKETTIKTPRKFFEWGRMTSIGLEYAVHPAFTNHDFDQNCPIMVAGKYFHTQDPHAKDRIRHILKNFPLKEKKIKDSRSVQLFASACNTSEGHPVVEHTHENRDGHHIGSFKIFSCILEFLDTLSLP